MIRCLTLSISVCLLLTLNVSAGSVFSGGQFSLYSTGISPRPDEALTSGANNPDVETYTLNPVDTSMPTVNDTGDMIHGLLNACNGPQEAWFGFDLSSIPEDATVVSASLSLFLLDFDGIPSQRTLWYYSDDSWISIADQALSDPGDNIVPDLLVGTIQHDETQYTWKTINITYDGWANDIADGHISLMLTGPIGGYEAGAAGLNLCPAWGITAVPELTLKVLSGPKSKVYKNVFDLGPEEILKINDVNIDVDKYSVPSFADWNSDGARDLVVGTGDGKVLVILNTGTDTETQFSDAADKSFYAKSGTSDLYVYPTGCMGCFPRVVYWNDDNKKDLLVGMSSGTIKIFLNINTDQDPIFDNGTLLTTVSGQTQKYISVGGRATPSLVDWNNDGLRDLVSGDLNGYIRIFINTGTNTEPVFSPSIFAADVNNVIFSVPSGRSSPVVMDLNFDGKKDILAGNAEGRLLLYTNVGSDKEPRFSGYREIKSDGIPIHLPDSIEGGPRTRPFVCYWDDDGYPDVLIGAYDGMIHLYRCKPAPADFDHDGDIDFADWAKFAKYWGKTNCGECGADFNGDGKIDVEDATYITENWLLNIK